MAAHSPTTAANWHVAAERAEKICCSILAFFGCGWPTAPPAPGLALHFSLNRIPDEHGDVGAAKVLDLTDAGWGGDIDLRQIGPDHVDAREQQPAPAQFRR